MGVDFITCANCGENFPDCMSYFWCDCGCSFCSNECGGCKTEEEETDGYDEVRSCIFCRMEQVKDCDIIKFLLSKCGITYEQAIEDYKKEHKSDE